jgi:hypothetical protein
MTVETPALAELSLRVNGDARRATARRERDDRDLNRAIQTIILPAVQFPVAAGVLSDPVQTNLLGPEDGQVWDVRRLTVSGLVSPNNLGSLQNYNTATSPGADATIAAVTLLPGVVYSVTVIVQLSGTLGAGDTNNMLLETGNLLQTLITPPGVAGQVSNGPFIITGSAAGAGLTCAVEAIAASTVGAVYSAQITATPVGGDQVTLFREINSPTSGNPQNALHTFTSAAADWEPGGGLVLRSPESLLLAGSGLAAASVLLSGEAVAIEAAWLSRYLL